MIKSVIPFRFLVFFGIFRGFRHEHQKESIFSRMNDLYLDESKDIHADGGRIVRTTTLAQSVGQAALCTMRTEEGEAFADPEEGVPWFGQILGLPATHLDIAVSIIRDRLEGIRGVRKVDSVEIRMPSDGKPGIMRNIGGRVSLTAEDGSTATEDF